MPAVGVVISSRRVPGGCRAVGPEGKGWGVPCAEWPAVWQGLSAPRGDDHPPLFSCFRLISEVVPGPGQHPGRRRPRGCSMISASTRWGHRSSPPGWICAQSWVIVFVVSGLLVGQPLRVVSFFCGRGRAVRGG